ncbi:UNVERIFIED_ORG: ADP-ribose pyrophosphatase YjhB (NUDIX family) [Kosakonia oryzae]|uniref:ADP-ribose pyrophosphatase YjhB, NUDIX family n=1 Tax=Kosakonia radicincitans TaxID=283686 RepID=A0AAX2EUL6_9ENTR|nr:MULTISPECIES: NUDIX domain-containing protein [Kosakonia]MDP9567901.1 ADP-ribose pyrophosphatase YjhB (NUDIX family) [Kosakonia oryzae]NCF06124.1 NUDIX domain-containing protein [Kosakonia sp. MH5]SFF01530.1 ADP-ribose pyrophosphatase YjhB, NUDIX family [Kosakonia radicincitans]SFR19782.1 ADP-ribose pyrophosphatase YjhB, NUDIX family [Kosakonia radicincitans]SFT85427.1 ADP-ribose pyrophosphatase YjhB, NUDIX family [Kosakonia radicincitans]
MISEAEYLEAYDASRFPSPLVTVDSVLFTVHQQVLCVLLVKRASQPQQGRWGLPGGFIDMAQDDSTRTTALRKLTEKTGVSPSWLEQLDTFSGPQRDPRGWSLTIAWYALISWVSCAPHIASVSDAKWAPVSELDTIELAFDHRDIIQAALHRLRQKTMYSLLPVYCLPETFTQAQLQEATEIILGQPIQRKSLIRRFEASGMFEETGQSVATGARKARLWRRKPDADIHLFTRNLLADG